MVNIEKVKEKMKVKEILFFIPLKNHVPTGTYDIKNTYKK